jgi:hypothetical protein
MALYEKSVKMLFRDFIKEFAIEKGQVIDRQKIYSWFKQKYPLIKQGTISAHVLLLSINAPSRIHHPIDPNGKDDLFYQIDSKRFRLYDPVLDPIPIYIKTGEEETNSQILENQTEENEFAYERDLQNFLAKNLNKIEYGLTLYNEEGINGLEFPVGNRTIDILALDKHKNFVVIELKVSRGYDRVVGQILRYIAWIRKNLSDSNQKVRGVIISREITEDLLLACSETKNIELYEYSLSVSLRKITND